MINPWQFPVATLLEYDPRLARRAVIWLARIRALFTLPRF